MNVLLTMGAIVLALSPLHIVMKILLALTVGGNAIFTAIYLVIGAVASSAITGLFGMSSFWTEAVPIMITFTLDAFLIAGLLYFTAVTFITPSSANRSYPLRIYITFFLCDDHLTIFPLGLVHQRRGIYFSHHYHHALPDIPRFSLWDRWTR